VFNLPERKIRRCRERVKALKIHRELTIEELSIRKRGKLRT